MALNNGRRTAKTDSLWQYWVPVRVSHSNVPHLLKHHSTCTREASTVPVCFRMPVYLSPRGKQEEGALCPARMSESLDSHLRRPFSYRM